RFGTVGSFRFGRTVAIPDGTAFCFRILGCARGIQGRWSRRCIEGFPRFRCSEYSGDRGKVRRAASNEDRVRKSLPRPKRSLLHGPVMSRVPAVVLRKSCQSGCNQVGAEPAIRMRTIETILESAAEGRRVSSEEAVRLFEEAALFDLAYCADRIRQRIHPDNVISYIIDRNINYTNVCKEFCTFCAFYRVK